MRNAAEQELDALAGLWFSGWQDGHTNILPAELARLRTVESFKLRLQEALAAVRVAQGGEAPLGFTMTKSDELYQFYVSAGARGTGVASMLMNDALARFRQDRVRKPWLACAIGNERAARFYEKSGWRRTGVMTSHLPTQAGIFLLDVWRYEIDLQ
ncbi:GNAT family N-acetyltransferase [Sphingomonas oleivorans]|uniref:GNAT family N-acetyltransferase n=1 Tax=Sphingomonas oleivorans TaxID=1735121 RepID=A0A2T5G0B5_9SPHN|nr:GNAT family N-acetyltransferase [Sphingomonas oleivorans]